MTTVTVLAPDSSLAMDEVIRKLGENAYILSTTHRDGQVEICATNEPVQDGKAPKKPEAPASPFQAILETNGGAAPATPPKKDRPPLRSVDGGLAHPEPRPPAPPESAADSAETIRTAAAKLSEVLGTLNAVMAQPLAQMPTLERLGFPSELIALHSTSGLSGEEADRAVLRSLARALIEDAPMATLDAPVTLVMGPSGGGKTVLAGKIAALLRETQPARTVSLGTLIADQPLAPCPLTSYARLLGLEHTISAAADMNLPEKTDDTLAQVIEVSLDGEPLEAFLASLRQRPTRDDIRIVIALPTGSSPERILAELNKYRGLDATIALCKLDECELSPREISAIAKEHVQIAWLSGTRSLTGNLAPVTFQMMNEFLEGLVFGLA